MASRGPEWHREWTERFRHEQLIFEIIKWTYSFPWFVVQNVGMHHGKLLGKKKELNCHQSKQIN